MSKNLPLVNIIILTYNQFGLATNCVDSLLRCGYPRMKIFIVDNNSQLESYSKFRNQYKQVNIIKFFRLRKNKGFAGGCNYALKRITKGYIVLLNDDTLVTKKWLQPIISYMESHLEVGACQPKLRDLQRKSYFEYAGAAGGFMDVYGFPFTRGRIFFHCEKDIGQYDTITDLVWVSGACMVTRYEVFKRVGMLDEIFFMYGEESDFCWRMNFYGYRLVFIPSSVVYHYGSATVDRFFRYRKIYFHHRNSLLLMLKNYTFPELVRYLPIRILFDYVAFWYYLIFNGIPMNSFAVVVAHLNVLLMLPAIYGRRKKAAFKIIVKNRFRYPLYRRSIVVDYFFYRNQKFSQLKNCFL